MMPPGTAPEFHVQSIWRADGGICAVNAAGEARCTHVGTSGVRSFASLGKVRSILSGAKEGAALLSSGQVVLFGWVEDAAKQAERVVSAKVPGLSDVVSMARHSGLGGGVTICAVRRSGKVGCVVSKGFDKKAPVPPVVVDVAGIGDAVAIAGGDERMCVVHRTGAVDCLRTEDVQSSGDSKPASKKVELERVTGVDDAIQIGGPGGGALGSWCVIRKGGALACWGFIGDGQLGPGDRMSHSEVAPVSNLGDVVSVAVGDDHACAVKKGGEVLCWGENTLGQVGQPAPAHAFEPVTAARP